MHGLALIGPPGAGKSTLMHPLRARLGLGDLDTDQWIEQEHEQSLEEIYEERGGAFLVREEERCLRAHNMMMYVVATSGSVVLSRARSYLRTKTFVVWIDVAPEETARFSQEDPRPIIGEGSVEEIMSGRRALYGSWAHAWVRREDKSEEELEQEIYELWNAQR